MFVKLVTLNFNGDLYHRVKLLCFKVIGYDLTLDRVTRLNFLYLIYRTVGTKCSQFFRHSIINQGFSETHAEFFDQRYQMIFIDFGQDLNASKSIMNSIPGHSNYIP